MTCIVGIIDKKSRKVFIGADSAGVGGYDLTRRKDKKVFRVGDFVIGCTSSFRMIQILNYSFVPPPFDSKLSSLESYMCKTFIKAVRDAFRDAGFLTIKDGEESGGIFLVAFKDRLFRIEDDFQVGELYDNFNSVGCGENYAKGALFSTKDMPTKQRILHALRTAEHFSTGVSGPFHIIST